MGNSKHHFLSIGLKMYLLQSSHLSRKVSILLILVHNTQTYFQSILMSILYSFKIKHSMQDTYYNDSTLTEYNISEITGCHVSNLLYFRKCYHFASFCYLEDFFFYYLVSHVEQNTVLLTFQCFFYAFLFTFQYNCPRKFLTAKKVIKYMRGQELGQVYFLFVIQQQTFLRD